MGRTRPSLGIPLAVCALLPLAAFTARAQKVQYSSMHRNTERALPQTVTGGTARLRAMVAAGAGTALVAADFDSDGTPDIISGYATPGGGALLLQRGSPVAQSPTARELTMMAAGQFVTPFIARAEPIELPVRPDLLASGDIQGFGHQDLLTAQKGDTALYLLGNDGSGSFAIPQAIALSGRIGAITVWRAPSGDNFIVAGVCGSAGCGLQFLARDHATREFVTRAFVAMPGVVAGAVTSIQIGNLTNGSHPDLAVIAGGRVAVLDGDTILAQRPTVEILPVANAAALALGNFVFDNNPGLQLAVLGTDATLHVITRAGVSSTLPTSQQRVERLNALRLQAMSHQRPTPSSLGKRTGQAWQEVETVHAVGSGGLAVTMLRGRFSGGGGDDLAVLSGNQSFTIAHPQTRSATSVTTEPIVTVDSSSVAAIAAVATRVTPDSRLGVVSLAQGAHPLTVMPPASPHRTITVQLYTDSTPTSGQISDCEAVPTGASCTLRAAVTVANLDRGANPAPTSQVDTIILKPNTKYTLLTSAYNTSNASSTTAQMTDNFGGVNHHLEVDGSTNIVGAGCTNAGVPNVIPTCSSTIDANQVDATFSINFGSFYSTQKNQFESASTDVFLTGMAILNGKNPNGCTEGECDGGQMEWDGEGGGNLVLTSVLIMGGSNPDGQGGGVTAFADGVGGSPGPLEVDNSTFISNTDVHEGGGVYVYSGNSLILTGDYFAQNSSDVGGGLYDAQATPGGSTITISNSYFLSNSSTGAAVGQGGGAYLEGPLTMSGTTFKGNTGQNYGGGLYYDSETYAGSITTSTFIGNMVVSQTGSHTLNSTGGGACLEGSETKGEAIYSVNYSRFYGNTLADAGGATGLGVACEEQASASETVYITVNATDNWWGCNGAATGPGCDTSITGNSTPADTTLTLSPYTVLTVALNAATPGTPTSLNVSGSLGQDSSGTSYTTAEDAGYDGVAATLQVILGTTVTPYNGTLSGNAAITASAITTSTTTDTGTPVAKVDGATVAPPMIEQAFGASTIAPGASTSLTFTLSNLNSMPISALAFTDTLPSGLIVTTPVASTTCAGGTLTATTGAASVKLTGATLAADTSAAVTCTVTVNVTASTAGTRVNSVASTAAVPGLGTVTGNTSTQTLTAMITPTRVVYGTPPGTPITAGRNAGSITASLQDASGNTTSTSGTSVTLAVTGPNGYSQTYTASTTSGIATFNLSSVALTVAGTYTYTASSAGLTSAVAMETVNPGALYALNVIGYPTSTSAQLAGIATVRAVDSYGNTVTSFTGTVTVTTTDATATISPAMYTYTGSDAGLHAFNVIFNTAGTRTITATFGAFAGTESNIVVSDAIWVLAATGQRTEIGEAGTTITSPIGTSGTASTYGGLAIDGAGDVWSVASGTNALAFSTYTGAGATTFSGGGLSTPAGVAIDGLGKVWVVNSGTSTVSEFFNGTALSPTVGFSTEPTGTGTTGSSGLAIDISGSVWVANGTANTVTRILGAAAPVVSPVAVGISNLTQGSRP